MITEITEEMEVLEAGMSTEEMAWKFGEKEAARRTRIGYPYRMRGVILKEHQMSREETQKVSREGEWGKAEGTGRYISYTERLYHPVLEEVLLQTPNLFDAGAASGYPGRKVSIPED